MIRNYKNLKSEKLKGFMIKSKLKRTFFFQFNLPPHNLGKIEGLCSISSWFASGRFGFQPRVVLEIKVFNRKIMLDLIPKPEHNRGDEIKKKS
jgi:hypothetical protein